MNVVLRKIRNLLVIIVSFFVLAGCDSLTSNAKITSIEVDTTSLEESYDLDNFDLSSIKIKVFYTDGEYKLIPLTKEMLLSEQQSLLESVGEHEITINFKGKQTSVILNLTYGELKQRLMRIYELAATQGGFIGTYEEWLESIKGPAGDDGREVTFQVADGFIKWQYVGDTSWTNLVELTSLVGPAGKDGTNGTDGREVTFRVSNNYIEWQYQGDLEW
ncbi:MAG: hypothetical protein GX931_02355, partial [Acholeplasmataceae bacterium]|nr:hypothetical protein [Acholeplasmataceae bacterium]